MSNQTVSLGRRLARAREDAKLEQEDAASAVGIHAVTLSRYENGKRPVPAAVRRKLAVLYGLSPNTFEDAPADQPTDPVRRESDAPDDAGAGRSGIDALVAGLRPGMRQADGWIAFPPETYGFLLGRLVTIADVGAGMADQLGAAARAAQATSETMRAIRGTVERVTNGVTGLTRGGVLPLPEDGLTPDERRRMAEILALVEERRRQEADDKTPPGRAAGGA